MKSQKMPEAHAVEALAALAQGQRLRAFRALVVAGDEGLTPGASVVIDGFDKLKPGAKVNVVQRPAR